MTPPVFAHGHLRLYLLALLNEQPRHGYELIQALSDRFDGTYAPSAGTIYPRLAKLEAEGLVTKETEGRKTVYRITDEGRREVEARADDLADIEADVDSSVRRLARELRDDLTAARDQLRSEFSNLQERSAGDDGPSWGSDFGKKATEFAQRAAAAATAGWSAGESSHRDGGDFGTSASAAFHAASGTFSTDDTDTDTDTNDADADQSPGNDRANETSQDGGSSASAGSAGSARGAEARDDQTETANENANANANERGASAAGTDGEPRPQDAPTPQADSHIARRADLSLDRFRQDIRQDLRRAEAEGRVNEDVLHLIDAELGRVRDLLHHVLSPKR